jgi:hypothetical protein
MNKNKHKREKNRKWKKLDYILWRWKTKLRIISKGTYIKQQTTKGTKTRYEWKKAKEKASWRRGNAQRD